MSATTQNIESQVHVMMLIEGGHQCELSLSFDSPLLLELLEALQNRSQGETENNRLFQIPVDEGRSMLYFPSHSIVAIATDPPLTFGETGELKEMTQMVQSPPEPTPTPQTETPQTQAQSTADPNPNNGPVLIESRYFQIENFLTPKEHNRLLNYVLNKKSEFVQSTVSSGDPEYRKSLLLFYFEDFAELIQARLKQNFSTICKELGIGEFPISQIETQITAHNDGHYYKAHNDNGDEKTATRAISYVYYFNREPKQFSGGELKIYDSWKHNESYYTMAAESSKVVQPYNNSIVFFSSSCCHEVQPVRCSSNDFADSRFTLNGWIRY
ncbi:MAG: proline hydroxylase [Cyanobacteria bacterium J007]|nr:MAG: proline hydroxylase [Cyanobacteria bacterium J007]